MAPLNISMPHEISAITEAFVSDPIRLDRKETNRLLVEGLESGMARPLVMVELKKRAQTLLNQGKCSK